MTALFRRTRNSENCSIVGQTTYSGTVYASDDWDEPGRVKHINPGLSGSLEARLHAVSGETGHPDFWLDLRHADAAAALGEATLQRFIGVIYRPDTERWSHYVETVPGAQYDALLYFDRTRALTPLDADPGSEPEGEQPGTFPSGK